MVRGGLSVERRKLVISVNRRRPIMRTRVFVSTGSILIGRFESESQSSRRRSLLGGSGRGSRHLRVRRINSWTRVQRTMPDDGTWGRTKASHAPPTGSSEYEIAPTENPLGRGANDQFHHPGNGREQPTLNRPGESHTFGGIAVITAALRVAVGEGSSWCVLTPVTLPSSLLPAICVGDLPRSPPARLESSPSSAVSAWTSWAG
jgi:hypothetical protein